ncbi:maleylpyruvate isomerase family mycothiol-dependent enzyme [Actinomadura viridis]|uniref:Uncharacterized protein (TIGR03083 family) n=1 Tax=Actinomadura viridis TaxID=58110 RepID=A0A931GSS2_9ACTN|nr:maleylpyruvate isomerase family mycothiol-dependent enzyme [Actinomadura viridis]MBG6091159.1 uncharacterized protein (TIGR03083 family) [Actinomadura viridis]
MLPLDKVALPFEKELRAERLRLIETLESLSDEEFDSGPTLCAGWAPRDVLGHVIGTDYLGGYLEHGPGLDAANQALVDRTRRLSRDRLMEWARQWAARPSVTSRLGALIMFGDVSVHHQDVLRGLGRERAVPDAVGRAVFREGAQLSLWLNQRVLRHRLVPTDGGRPFALPGAGKAEARGTREALGMWLAGRDAVAGELEFA